MLIAFKDNTYHMSLSAGQAGDWECGDLAAFTQALWLASAGLTLAFFLLLMTWRTQLSLLPEVAVDVLA